MALAVGSLIEMTVVGKFNAQVYMNVFQYEAIVYPTGVTAAQVAEAYWAHIKATARPLVAETQASGFLAIKCRELDSATGDYGEFGVPAAEQAGTMAVSGSDTVPPFVAAGVRLAVKSRLTRPGQKRFGGMTDAMIADGLLQPAYLTLLNAHMNVLTADMLLGAPAATTTLRPVVVSKDRATGLPTAFQRVTGYVVNTFASSQVSRKVGRGI